MLNIIENPIGYKVEVLAKVKLFSRKGMNKWKLTNHQSGRGCIH